MSEKFVRASIEDGVLNVLIDRAAKRNALSLSIFDELRETFTRYADDSALLCAVIRGAGERCFAAGGDLVELDAIRDSIALAEMSQTGFAGLQAIRDFPVPVIAALNGDAIGGGAELAIACDMRVFARHARMGFVQGNLNITPAWGGSVDLMRLVGLAPGLRLLTRAEMLSADEAFAVGIAQAVAEDSQDIDQATTSFLAPMRKMSPQVMRAHKTLARAEHDGLGAERMRELELQSLMQTWLHDDHWAAAAKVHASLAAKR